MKKFTLLTLLLIMILGPRSLFGQNVTEVVYLKNGSIIKGFISEWVPMKYIKVVTSDENVFVCNIDEIEKIIRTQSSHIEVAPVPIVVQPEKAQQAQQVHPVNDQAIGSQTDHPGSTIKLPKVSSIPPYRSPGAAFFWSFVIPGGGQIYNRQAGKGLLLMTCNVLGIGAMVVGIAVDELGVWIPGVSLYGATWLYSIMEAPIMAKKINTAYGLGINLVELKRSSLRIGPSLIPKTLPNRMGITPGISLSMNFH